MRSDYATLSDSSKREGREAKTKRSEYPERGTGPGTSTAGYDGYRQISMDGHRRISGDGHRQISVGVATLLQQTFINIIDQP
jgi:hypothetical protein